MSVQDNPSGSEGISLDELARAFAQVMGTAPKLRAPPQASTGEASAALPTAANAVESGARRPLTTLARSAP